MRQVSRVVLLAAIGWAAVGCSHREFKGPTVDAFTGHVVREGEPVSFPAGEEVSLTLFLHETGESFGIPLQSDGTFKLGWMPIGKYTVMLNRPPKNGRGQPTKYSVPGELNIEAGKTEYTIELGKNWKP